MSPANNPPRKPPLPLRQRWTKLLGAEALPLLDDLRRAYVPAHGGPARFDKYARNICRNCTTIPQTHRVSYVQRCLDNLLRPPPEQEYEPVEALFSKLEKRVGFPAAWLFFWDYSDLLKKTSRASEATKSVRLESVLARAVAARNPKRFMQAVIADEKRLLKLKKKPRRRD